MFPSNNSSGFNGIVPEPQGIEVKRKEKTEQENIGPVQELLHNEVDNGNFTVLKPHRKTNEPVHSVTIRLPQFFTNLPQKVRSSKVNTENWDIMEQIKEETEEFYDASTNSSSNDLDHDTIKKRAETPKHVHTASKEEIMKMTETKDQPKQEDRTEGKLTTKVSVKHDTTKNTCEENLTIAGTSAVQQTSSSFASHKEELGRHGFLHTCIRPQCLLCERKPLTEGKAYSYKISFPEKPSLTTPQCNICAQSFSCQAYLLAHSKSHQGGRYSCKVCNKSFSQKTQVQNHMAIHTGEKYVCEFCKRKFKTRQYLHNHIRSHGNQTCICTYCNASFSQQTYLNRHIARGCKHK